MIFHKILLLTLALSAASIAHAEAPELQTPAPVIYLSDNLDEADNLGWCIDTVGRGFAENLHAHSCKPRGGDVQFSYDADSSQIASATYENKCATLQDEATAKTQLGLVDCDAEAAAQHFVYNGETGHIHPKSDEALCLAVGEASRSAGPFMSRDLVMTPCEETEAKFTHWTILTE